MGLPKKPLCGEVKRTEITIAKSLLGAVNRHPALIGSSLGTSLMGLAYLVFNGLPRYFYGDDYLLLMASRSPNGYASSLSGCVNDIGMGKWRPMFVCSVVPVLKLFGENYLWYFLFNLFLVFLISLTVGKLLQQIGKIPEQLIALCAFAMPFSRFAWYGRVGPFGLMEFGALLFALCFVRQYISALDQRTSRSWYFAGGAASLSALFHERYLVLLAAGLLVALFNVRNKSVRIPISPWILFSSLLFYVKVFRLNTDPLVGGGEATLRSSSDTWALEHFLIGVKAIVGIGNGTNIYFDTSGYARVPALGGFAIVWLSVLLVVVMVAAIFKSTLCSDVRVLETDTSNSLAQRRTIICQLLLSVGLLLIVPASTVISRIEGRWLFGPEVFLYVFAIVVLRSEKWRVVFATCFLLFSVTSLRFLSEYEMPLRLSNDILEHVHERLDGRTELVYAIRDLRGRPRLINWLDWSLGRGDKFKQIGVESVIRVADEDCSGSCIRLTFADTSLYKFVGS